jgi:hypothetical protein
MANFHTHITLSSFFGIGYGAAGHLAYDIPLPSAVIAGGLCGIAGMLPDVDSDNGVPLRESMSFLAAVIPMFFLERFRELGWPQESIVLAAALVYVVVRFGIAEFVRRATVHRGMWHSIPAAAIAGLITYHLCACPELVLRLYKTGAVVLGFMSHLVLDEIYSTDVGIRGVRLKKSFGTAVKMWGPSPGANLLVYTALALMITLTYNETTATVPQYADGPLPGVPFQVPHTAQELPGPYPTPAATPTYDTYAPPAPAQPTWQYPQQPPYPYR